MAATIRDIRTYTGLSLATISKYLNGGHVLEKNRLLIEKAIKELNYEVNELARGLVTQKTNVVGVLVYDISCTYIGRMLRHIGVELRKRGYGMMICDSGNNRETEAANLQFLLNKKVAGIIIFPTSLDGRFTEPARRADIPVILVDRDFQDVEFDCIEIDNRSATYRLMQNVLDHGHKKIAVIGSLVEYTGIERNKGFMEAMQERGLKVPEQYQLYGMHSFEHGYEGMNKLLDLNERPTAVFLSNYETMLGGITAMNERHISCPQDISIVGFDDLIVSQIMRPKPWLVSQPMNEMCAQVIHLLFERLNKTAQEKPLHIRFTGTIVEGSTISNLNCAAECL